MGYLLEQSATVMCSHGGQVTPTNPNPRVVLGGTPSVTSSAPWSVAGCPFPPNSGGPCATAMWSVATVRVTCGGQPLVVSTGIATCVPTGVPVNVVTYQMRVQAQ